MAETPFDGSLSHLDKIVEVANKAIDHFPGKGLTEFQFYAINMIERLRNRAASLRPLLREFTKCQDVEYGIGLLLRNESGDFLFNVYSKILQGEGKIDELNLYIRKLHDSGVNYTYKYFENGKGKHISEDQYQKALEFLKGHYPKCFDENGVFRKPEHVSITEVYKQLSNSKDFKNFALAYDSYLFYSKYEHYCKDSYIVTRGNAYNPFDSITRKVNLMIFHLNMLLSMLHFADTNDKDLLKVFLEFSSYTADALPDKD